MRPLLQTWLTLVVVVGCASVPRDRLSSAVPPGMRPAEVAALEASGIDMAGLRCNGYQTWSHTIRPDSEKTVAAVLQALERSGVTVPADRKADLREDLRDLVFWRSIRSVLLGAHQNNFGAVRLKGLTTAQGRPVTVFRTAVTPEPGKHGSCFESLLRVGGVRHVVNLYRGSLPTADLEAAERSAIEAAGGTYLLAAGDSGSKSWRRTLRDNPSPEHTRAAMEAVARVISDGILRPGGKPPTGNVHVHCGGGMHRTGMVVGVLERCVNGTSMEEIEDAYRFHTAWRSDDDVGGYEQGNVDFIRQFDCSLVRLP